MVLAGRGGLKLRRSQDSPKNYNPKPEFCFVESSVPSRSGGLESAGYRSTMEKPKRNGDPGHSHHDI